MDFTAHVRRSNQTHRVSTWKIQKHLYSLIAHQKRYYELNEESWQYFNPYSVSVVKLQRLLQKHFDIFIMYHCFLCFTVHLFFSAWFPFVFFLFSCFLFFFAFSFQLNVPHPESLCALQNFSWISQLIVRACLHFYLHFSYINILRYLFLTISTCL